MALPKISTSPAPTAAGASTNGSKNNGTARSNHVKSSSNGSAVSPTFPPPKTDKPRPHVCGTCQRSFARLEHLKRHERSHTKEKPFECVECSRCFARRDLLLRHQQKLHMITTPPSRPRGGRRGSNSAPAGGRGRKNSAANSSSGFSSSPGAEMTSMRPRANTISVDAPTLDLLAAANSSFRRSLKLGPGHSRHPSLNNLRGNVDNRYMGTQLGNLHSLPKLETGLGMELGGGLRTAPPLGGYGIGMGSEYGFESLPYFVGPDATINPAQLHFIDSPQSLAPPSPFLYPYLGMNMNQVVTDDDDSFDWMANFDDQLSLALASEYSIDGSSSSAISTASQNAISEVMLDGSNHPSGSLWNQHPMIAQDPMVSNAYAMDLSSTFGDVFPMKTLHDHADSLMI
ncbi:MAG: hypothetical protein M1829_004235 [Trizodia sp. TS-e1964]|nr:MAG: hypothetical protein M1829_004235 [Trizodia sp. TS-e1964]